MSSKTVTLRITWLHPFAAEFGRGRTWRHRRNDQAGCMVNKYCTCEATGLCYASLSVRMVNRCVAAGCSNTPSEGISLYKFPTDPRLREKWVKQVRRTVLTGMSRSTPSSVVNTSPTIPSRWTLPLLQVLAWTRRGGRRCAYNIQQAFNH